MPKGKGKKDIEVEVQFEDADDSDGSYNNEDMMKLFDAGISGGQSSGKTTMKSPIVKSKKEAQSSTKSKKPKRTPSDDEESSGESNLESLDGPKTIYTFDDPVKLSNYSAGQVETLVAKHKLSDTKVSVKLGLILLARLVGKASGVTVIDMPKMPVCLNDLQADYGWQVNSTTHPSGRCTTYYSNELLKQSVRSLKSALAIQCSALALISPPRTPPRLTKHCVRSPRIISIEQACGVLLPDVNSVVEVLRTPEVFTGHTYRAALDLINKPIKRSELPSLIHLEPDCKTQDRKLRVFYANKLLSLMSVEWIVNMCGGQVAFDSAPKSEREIAIHRKLLLCAGKNGASLATLCSAIEHITEFSKNRNYPHTFPISSVLLTNFSEFMQQQSPAFLKGKGGSIAWRWYNSFVFGHRHVGLPVDLTSPLAASLPPHQRSTLDQAGCLPIHFSFFSETQASCDTSPYGLAWQLATVWLHSSARQVEIWRSEVDHDWSFDNNAYVLKVSQTKSGAFDSRIAIPLAGFTGVFPWAVTLWAQAHSRGFLFPKPIFHSGLLIGWHLHIKATEKEISLIITALFTKAGYSPAEQKRLRLTPHSFHNLYDNIATILMWPADERTEMGRWAFAVDSAGRRRKSPGAAKIMHARYASQASVANQLRLRARLVSAVRFLVPDWSTLPLTCSLTCLSNSPSDILRCDQYGPQQGPALQGDDYFPSQLHSTVLACC